MIIVIKILFPNIFSYSRRGGVTIYIKLLSETLDKNKFQLMDLSKGEDARIEKQNPSTLKNNVLKMIILFYFRLTFKSRIDKYKPDIIHLNPSLKWFAILRDFSFLKMSKRKGIPTLFFIHGWSKSLFKLFKKYKILTNWFVKNLNKADAIVVLASEFKQDLVDMGLDEKKIFVLTTMVKTADFIPFKKNFNPPYRVLFCSNMIKEKGPYELLEAAKSIIKKYPSTRFIFMGKGKELENLKEHSRKFDIENNVKFKGFLTGNKKIEVYKKSHLFVFPSYREGFPTVVLEAMAAGLPVITTPVGGLKDEIKDGKNGFFIESMPPKPKDISEKIIMLIENPKLMKMMSKNNLKEARDKYDVKVVCNNIREIYEEIIKTNMNHSNLYSQ